MRMPTRSSAATRRQRWRCRSMSSTSTSRSARARHRRLDRTRGARPRATRSSSARRRGSARRRLPSRTRRDDQAETFLLRLLRGAGPRGLSGMHPRAGIVVRPFIDTSRSDVRAFLREPADRVSRGRVERRSRDSAQSHPSRAVAAARRALLAGHRRRARSRGRHRPRRRRLSRCRRARGCRTPHLDSTRAGVELDADGASGRTAGDRAARDSPRAADGRRAGASSDSTRSTPFWRFAVSKSTGPARSSRPSREPSRRYARLNRKPRPRETRLRPPISSISSRCRAECAVPEAACAISAEIESCAVGPCRPPRSGSWPDAATRR